MGDRIMVLNDGVIQQVGHPITLYNEPANLFVASFIGSPKMNMGRAVITNQKIVIENTLNIPLDSSIVQQIPNGRHFTVGIRAEHIPFGTSDNKTHEVEVINVEQLGNETLVTFEVGKELWSAKWLGQWMVNVGDRVPVQISVDYFNFFDSESGLLMKAASVGNQQEVLAI